MPDALLPLFPLGVVLFPRTALPLHIFEERYKEMIGEAIEGASEFGVVLAQENGILHQGCTARVERVLKKYEDGRMDIITLGARRFQLRRLEEGRSFLRGAVSFFDDGEGTEASFALRQRVTTGFQRLFAAQTQSFPFEIDYQDPQLSFQLAQVLPDLEVKQQLLGMRSEAERLEKLIAFFPVFAAQRDISEQIRRVAPTNGHGKHLPSPSDEHE